MGIVEGAAAVIIGLLLGRLLPGSRRSAKPPGPPEPLCGCEHHHSFHDPETGQCHSLMRVPGTMSRDSYHTPCTCRQYSGPLPLPEYYAPEIAREAGE
jgi:hypothetical protein